MARRPQDEGRVGSRDDREGRSIRDVEAIELRRIKAHLILEPELSLIDCGYADHPDEAEIHSTSIIDRRQFRGPIRGDVELVVGEPMWFEAETDHATPTTRLEAAVAAL